MLILDTKQYLLKFLVTCFFLIILRISIEDGIMQHNLILCMDYLYIYLFIYLLTGAYMAVSTVNAVTSTYDMVWGYLDKPDARV